jgi:hypothetical protein
MYYVDNIITNFVVYPDLLSPREDGLCLQCHYMHSQHFPNLKISDYMTSTSSLDIQPPPSLQHCSFCSEPFSGSLTASSSPLTSGLASLREVCGVRAPQTELECSLASKWTTGELKLFRNS